MIFEILGLFGLAVLSVTAGNFAWLAYSVERLDL